MLELHDEAIRRDGENTAALLAHSIRSSYAIANWSGAIADTTEAIRLEPKNANAYELRARASPVEGISQCDRRCDRGDRLDASRQESYVVRGTSYNGLGEWKHAIVDLNEVVRQVPNWSWNWFEPPLRISELASTIEASPMSTARSSSTEKSTSCGTCAAESTLPRTTRAGDR